MIKPTPTFLIYLPLSKYIPEMHASYLHLISEERKARVEKAPHKQKSLLVYSELLVRLVACKILDISYDNVHIERNAYGKPFIMNYPHFHFNVSHSNEALTLFVSNTSVGVDIEYLGTPYFNIARRFFTDEEFSYIFDNEAEKNLRFYEIWTRKEAYIKQIGLGLSLPLNSFNTFDSKLNSCFKTFHFENHIISICHTNKNLNISPTQISEQDIFSSLTNNQIIVHL